MNLFRYQISKRIVEKWLKLLALIFLAVATNYIFEKGSCTFSLLMIWSTVLFSLDQSVPGRWLRRASPEVPWPYDKEEPRWKGIAMSCAIIGGFAAFLYFGVSEVLISKWRSHVDPHAEWIIVLSVMSCATAWKIIADVRYFRHVPEDDMAKFFTARGTTFLPLKKR